MANFVIQDVQGFSSFQAALQFLPSIISGVLVGLLVGRLVTSIRADYIVLVATVFTSVASILMSMLDLQWVYWKCVFVAIFLSPIAAGNVPILAAAKWLFFNMYMLTANIQMRSSQFRIFILPPSSR
jgi:hypothetical protein